MDVETKAKTDLEGAKWQDMLEDKLNPTDPIRELLNVTDRFEEINTLIRDCIREDKDGIRGPETGEINYQLALALEVLGDPIDRGDIVAGIATRNRIRRQKLE